MRATPQGVAGDTSNIRHVSFKTKPNLYFVSFESIMPRSLLKKNLQLDGTDFHDVFEANFRPFVNMFSNARDTKYALSMVLALDREVYQSQLRQLKADPDLFAGRNPSPLLAILRENGYAIKTIYGSDFLGKAKGPYVDEYVVGARTLCRLLDRRLHVWAFWGYCAVDRSSRKGRMTRVVAAADGPRFTMEHINRPTHTISPWPGDAADGARERFRSLYLRKSNEAGRNLAHIVRQLREKDPNGILLVYGDHGPWLSRGLSFEDDPEFVVQDQHGVLGGVYPPTACEAWFDREQAKGWMTTLDAVHALLRCLSEGQDALIAPRRQRPMFPGGRGFDEFLYE